MNGIGIIIIVLLVILGIIIVQRISPNTQSTQANLTKPDGSTIEPTPSYIPKMGEYMSKDGFFSFNYPPVYTLKENTSASVDGVQNSEKDTVQITSPTIPESETNVVITIKHQGGDSRSLTELMKAFNISSRDESKFKPYTLKNIQGYIYKNSPIGPYGSTIILFHHPVKNAYKDYMITIESHEPYEKSEQYANPVLSSFTFK